MLLTRVEVQLGHIEGEALAIPATEAEHNHWLQLPLHYHFHHLGGEGRGGEERGGEEQPMAKGNNLRI